MTTQASLRYLLVQVEWGAQQPAAAAAASSASDLDPRVRLGELDEAARHFELSVTTGANVNRATRLGNYAHFLAQARRDTAAAHAAFDEAINLSPHDPNLFGNQAVSLIADGRIAEAWTSAKRSMALALGQADRLMTRSLFCAATILSMSGQDPSVPLGQLKTLFAGGIDFAPWVITALLEAIDLRLTDDRDRLLHRIADAIGSKAGLDRLEAEPAWQAIPPAPYDAAWPEPSGLGAVGSNFPASN